MEKSRKQKALINVLAYISYFLLTTVLGFVSKKIFLDDLGSEILGLTELLTSIISMLSLAELGFGSAIYYSLYKPLAENNQSEIQGIMNFYKKVYYVIGLIVLVLGLVVTPILPYIAKTSIANGQLYILYAIFLADTVLSYYLSYRRTIISADQKEYIATLADAIAYLATISLQIFVVIITKNVYAYLIIKVIFVMLRNLFLYFYAGNKYNYLSLDTKGEISSETKQELINNVKAIFLGNVGAYIITGTDNLYLSLFADLSAVYIYSNYKMIIAMVNGVFNQVFSYARANIGNFIVSHTKQEIYQLFKNLFFLNYLLTQYTSISMIVVLNVFIEIWLGPQYCWPFIVVFLILIKNYGSMMNQALEAFRTAAGLFAPKKRYRYFAMLEGLLNIFFSLLFVNIFNMKIVAIFAGTVVSNLFSVYAVPHMTYKYLFGEPELNYFKKYFIYLINTIFFASICIGIMLFLKNNSLLVQLGLGISVCFLIPLVGNIIFYYDTDEFRYLTSLIRNIINHKTFKC